ncbi:hypothetical protein K5549_021676, partial [Capra hircus]
MNVYSSLYLVDTSYTPVVKKLQLKTNSDRGEVFQSWILGRPERNEMDRFYLRVIQENIYNFQSKQKDEEENYKGILITHNENLTGNKDQHDKSVARIKPIENWLALSFQDELYIFKSEDKTDEFIQAHKILNRNGFSRCPPLLLKGPFGGKCDKCVLDKEFNHQRIHSQNYLTVGLLKYNDCGKVSHYYSFVTRYQRINPGEKIQKCNVCGKD